jgi:hypothetical protein
MPSNNTQKPFQPLPPAFDNLIWEPIGEHLSGEGRDIDTCGFALEDIAEGFKIWVTPADEGVAEFEGGNVRLMNDYEWFMCWVQP